MSEPLKLTPAEQEFWKQVYLEALRNNDWIAEGCASIADEGVEMLRVRESRAYQVPLYVIKDMMVQHDAAMEGLRVLIAKVYPDPTMSHGTPYEVRSHMATALRTMDALKDAIFMSLYHDAPQS